MRGLLWVLGLFALAVGISLAAHVNEGYVLLVVPPYRGEISLNLAIMLLILSFLLLHALVRAAALSLPRKVGEFRERRGREKALALLGDSVRLLFEGRYDEARKAAAKAHAATPSVAVPAALLAARASQGLGDAGRTKEWIERANQGEGGQGLQAAGLMLEAEMFLATSRFAETVDVLARLRTLAPESIAALRLELRAQQGLGTQEEADRIVRSLEKLGVSIVRKFGLM